MECKICRLILRYQEDGYQEYCLLGSDAIWSNKLAGLLTFRGYSPARSKRVFSSPKRQDHLWDPSNLFLMGTGFLSWV